MKLRLFFLILVVNFHFTQLKSDEIFNLGLAESDDVVERFIENQDRDNDDRARYSSLYGFDYGNLDGYDIVINTTNKESDFVFKEVVRELEKSGFRTN